MTIEGVRAMFSLLYRSIGQQRECMKTTTVKKENCFMCQRYDWTYPRKKMLDWHDVWMSLYFGCLFICCISESDDVKIKHGREIPDMLAVSLSSTTSQGVGFCLFSVNLSIGQQGTHIAMINYIHEIIL